MSTDKLKLFCFLVFMTNYSFVAKGYLWSKVYQILKSQALSCLVLLLSEPSAILICTNTEHLVYSHCMPVTLQQ